MSASTNVKVFALKFFSSLLAYYFFMCTWIEFIFGMMIDTGLTFLSAVSAPIGVKVTDRILMLKSLC